MAVNHYTSAKDLYQVHIVMVLGNEQAFRSRPSNAKLFYRIVVYEIHNVFFGICTSKPWWLECAHCNLNFQVVP